MESAHQKYSPLLTDLYQLTMACGYWKTGFQEREAVFHLFFRKNPFRSGFSMACGLADAIEYLEEFRFSFRVSIRTFAEGQSEAPGWKTRRILEKR